MTKGAFRIDGYNLGEEYGVILPRDTHLFDGLQLNQKSTEYIEFKHDDEVISFINTVTPEDGVPSFPIDILNQGTIPSPSIRISIATTAGNLLYATFDFKSPEEIKAIQLRLFNTSETTHDLADIICGACTLWSPEFDHKCIIPVCVTNPRPNYFECDIAPACFMKGGHISNITYNIVENDSILKADPTLAINLARSITNIRDEVTVMMYVWYAIQVHLLNPLCQEYVHKETVPDNTSQNSKKSQKKQPKKYIKRILIDMDKMTELGVGNATKNHTIKCPVWWVIGHWRTYKATGKRIWIDGYWKGVLRDLQISETRERVI